MYSLCCLRSRLENMRDYETMVRIDAGVMKNGRWSQMGDGDPNDSMKASFMGSICSGCEGIKTSDLECS